MRKKHIHTLQPIYNEHSRILILGSFPSVQSRATAFYYGHAQNRFWKVMASVCGEAVPTDVEAKQALLITHGIALWDVIGSCTIEGSSDASISDVVVNDLAPVVAQSAIQHVFCNGKRAYQLYRRYQQQTLGIEATLLPSTSPANAAWSLEALIEVWSEIRSWL